MKTTILLLLTLQLGFSSTLSDVILNDKECHSAISKDYKKIEKDLLSTKIGSKEPYIRALQCKTLFNLSKKLEKHTNYRDLTRVTLLNSLLKTVYKMKHHDALLWSIKQEAKKNTQSLKNLSWKHPNFLYFGVEINQNKISFIDAMINQKYVEFKTKEYDLFNSNRANGVYICTLKEECISINSNSVSIYPEPYNLLKIVKEDKEISLKFKIDNKNLISFAYETYAQLFNLNSSPLSTINTNTLIAKIEEPIDDKEEDFFYDE